MKILQYIALASATLGLAFGCGKFDRVTAPDPADTKAAKLTKWPAEIVVTAENEATEIAAFEWEAADYGVQALVSYQLMLSVAGGEPVAINEAGFATSANIGYDKLNKAAVAAGAKIAKEGEDPIANDVIFTVTSLLSAKYAAPLISEGAAATITGYTPAASYLWIAGTINFPAEWNPGHPQAPKLTQLKPGTDYEGMVDLNSTSSLQFKFCAKPSWDGPNYGGSKDKFDSSGTAPNIADLEGGYYRLVVDPLVTRVTTALKITSIGAIGDALASGWDAETEKMVYEKETNTWTIASIAMTADKEFKLRVNENWSYAIGGTLEEASFTGGNFKVTGDTGNYKIVLNAGVFPYTITLTKL